jgi:chemotaxis protein CheX
MTVTTTTVVETLIRVTEEVFQTMVFRQLAHKVPIVEGDALRPTSNVVGTVGFAGSSNGLVAFYSTLDAARNIASAMLGMPEDEIERDSMADAIGEITNMIAGSFRTRMAANGDAWAITVPTVTIGSDFYIKPLTNGHRVLIPFGMAGHEVFVELILTEPLRRTPA